MADFLQMLFEVLRVQDLASKWSGNPLDQFLYTVFFPSIFVILIVYIIANRFATFGRMWKMLIGVSIYIFIVVWPPNATSSLYSMFARFGEAWYILIIILVGLWAIFKTFFPSEGGGAGGAQGARSGLGSQLMGRLWKDVTGQTKDLAKQIDAELNTLESFVNRMKHSKSQMDINDVSRAIPEITADIAKDLASLRQMMSMAGGLKINSKMYDDRLKKFESLSNRAKHEMGKRK